MMKVACVNCFIFFVFCPHIMMGQIQNTKIINSVYDSIIDLARSCININDTLSQQYYLKAFAEEAPQNPIHIYEAAVMSARLRQKDLAFTLLNLSIEKGFSYYEHIKKNTNLPLLDNDKYEKCVEKVKFKDSILCQISLKLDNVFEQDQHIRNYFFENIIYKEIDPHSFEAKLIIDSMLAVDYANLLIVNDLVDKYGFLGNSLRTSKSQNAMFLIYLHASVEEKEDKLPLLQKAVKRGELSPEQYPYFEDKILYERKGIQKYGTQYNIENDNIVFFPFIDSINVNQYRKEFHMGTLEDYIIQIKEQMK